MNRKTFYLALDIGAGGVGRIGPPIVSFRKEVVRPAGTARASAARHRDGGLLQSPSRLRQYLRAQHFYRLPFQLAGERIDFTAPLETELRRQQKLFSS